MSSIATLNGVQYIVPAYNDTGWAQGAGNLSLYLAAIAANTLQPTGGSFTLTADVDFGASFGLKALFLKTETANPASAGVIRLAKTDTIGWRNNANGADITIDKDTSDNLRWNSNKIYTAGGAAGIVNADIAAGAAIAYSKLALTGAILNADLAGSIAYSKLSLTGAILNADLAGSIAYSKLTLTGAIVNGDLTAGTILNSAINASAAIALTKLAALTSHSRALASDASGFIVESAVTATELGYVSGVTSAIQTQLNATIANPLTANLAAGTHKLTGLAAGSANGDSIRYEQVINQRVLQIVTSATTPSVSTTSASFASATSAVTITPSSTTSKILLFASGNGTNANAASTNGHFTISGTANGNLGDATIGLACLIGTSGSLSSNVTMFASDTPGTVSAQTYTIQFKSIGGALISFGSGPVKMIAVEIG